MEVYTIFGSENLGGLIFDVILSGGPGGKALWESRVVLGAERPSNKGNGRGEGTVNGFWGMVTSRGMVKVGLI